MIIFKISCLILGLLLPAIVGYSWLGLLGISLKNSWLEALILSFLIGWAFFSFIFIIFGFIGIPLNLSSGIGLIILLWSFSNFFAAKIKRSGFPQTVVKPSQAEKGKSERKIIPRIFTWCLIGLSCLLFILLLFQSPLETNSYPLQGVWGYKAMVIFREQGIPLSLFSDSNTPFTHPSYPLVFPVMLAWNFICLGEFCDSLIKLTPPLLGILVFLSLFQIMRREKVPKQVALVFCLLFFGGKAFITTSTVLYAENLLILYVLWGCYFLYFSQKYKRNEFFYVGFFILGFSTLIKNEGLVYFSLATVYILVSHCIQRKRNFLQFFLPATVAFLVFIIPWLVFQKAMAIQIRDFSLEKPFETPIMESLKTLKDSTLHFFHQMFLDYKSNSGLWYITIFVVILFRKKIIVKENLFLLFIAFTMILILVTTFVFSTRPLHWHMDAVLRLQLIPLAMLVLISSFSIADE